MVMQRHRIQSSNILDAGYDADSGVLEITFKSGTRYAYRGVSPMLFEDFMAAESKGSFFAREIRPHFEGVPVFTWTPCTGAGRSTSALPCGRRGD